MHTQTVALNGIELHYRIDGDGEPLLLLHGGTGCSEDWSYAGRERFAAEYKLIAPDARGHGRSSHLLRALSAGGRPEKAITHRQCALDTLALLDHLGIARCRAVGVSMGGNILLHMATMQPERIAAMVAVSATMYFPAQAREIMRQVPAAENQSAAEWERMRRSHTQGDVQVVALWDWARGLADSYEDMNFTPPALGRITARALVVYGDRDPLYPLEIGVEMYRAIPRAELWVVPGGGHGPVFGAAADGFAREALRFLRG
jgi:pimeloyl-ACP methyl ester carboxylesterase